MSDRCKKALLKRMEGYNCAQAVLCAFDDIIGIPEETLFKLSEGLGSGMGGMKNVCGAATGMFMAADLILGKSTPANPQSNRAAAYKRTRELAEKFKERTGSLICADLLGENGKRTYACNDCVTDAVDIWDEYIKNESGKESKI